MKMTHFHSAKLVLLDTWAGAHVDECAAEAVRLALELRCRVEFKHNDRTYYTDPSLIRHAVVEIEES